MMLMTAMKMMMLMMFINVDVDEAYAQNKCGLRSVSAQLQQISQLAAAASVFTFLSSSS